MTTGVRKNNRYICEILPKIYMIDSQRNISELEQDILMYQEEKILGAVREDRCIFDSGKKCRQCFTCMGGHRQKKSAGIKSFRNDKTA